MPYTLQQLRPLLRDRPVDVTRCTFRGCELKPFRLLTPSNGARPWVGCRKHWQTMEKALLAGMPGATSGGSWVDAVRL